MNKTTKNKLIVTIFALFAFTNAMCQVDSSFTYQGELFDNGSPANGQYDINIDLIDGDSQPWGSTSVHSPVVVVNGIFSVNANFGISTYDGYKDVTVSVSVRKTSEGPAGAFTVLGSQTIQSVPLATNLTNGSASNGQVLTFNGFQWAPSNLPINTQPWNISGQNISYTNGKVGIGVVSPSDALEVSSTSDQIAAFNGSDSSYVYFRENNQGRGYIGSVQSTTNPEIHDEDFEIGTTFGSVGSMHISTGDNEPRITVTKTGDVGIGDLTPDADLQINGIADGDVLRVRIGNSTKLYVDVNGGVGVGSWDTPPVDGLLVKGDVKQRITSNGMMKYMINAKCGNSLSNIINSYNGVGTTTSATITNGPSAGKCILDFSADIDITGRYFQVSVVDSNTGSFARTASCRNLTGKLYCARVDVSTGAGANGDIMVFIY